ncbi:MAG: ABC transporter permease [Holosporales bacterium]|nr:ABC transporter permease [Holosporales bacterium]
MFRCRSTLNTLAYIGRHTINLCTSYGQYIIFLYNSVQKGLSPPYYWRQILIQLKDVGFYSLPVIGLTAIFTGAVLALQSYTGFSRFSAESALPMLVVLCITRELGPVIAGLMFAGRVGATMAAEIGTMKVTEQIDALTTLSTCSYRYLYWPRIVAGLITLPMLVFIFDIIGVLGGLLVSVAQLDFNAQQYLKMTEQFVQAEDVISGLIKSAFFGLTTALTGCFKGATSSGGSAGVGRATMNAVVLSSITILCLNYILTTIIFSK